MGDRPRLHVPGLHVPGPGASIRASRRRFLAGIAASSLLAACGDDGGTASPGDPAGGGDAGEPELSVVRFFGPYFVAGAANRIPFGIADAEGILPREQSPDEVTVSVKAPDGSTIAEELTSSIRDEGLPRAYYAVEFTPDEPGFYDFTVRTDAGDLISQVQVVGSDDPSVVPFVGPGDEMPALATPTTADPRGVTPICTREPVCPLHDVAVADVVGTGPLALLVATPAFCQTVICGPVLDILLERIDRFPDISFVHAEVFADPTANEQPPSPDDFAPAVRELGLPFEPVLYTVGADGVVRDRLDYIFDGSEITETLERLLG
jgi:hypothetical protein